MSIIIYEITATAADPSCRDCERFMTERHIPDLLATGAFAGAKFSRSSVGRYRVLYEARSRAALDDYLTNHALRLRAHMAQEFPEGIEFTREEWQVLASFDAPANRIRGIRAETRP